MTAPGPPRDDVDAITAALARLRGRRPARPLWDDGTAPHAHGPHHGRGPHGHDTPPWVHPHGPGSEARAWPQGMPPWMSGAHARFGGPARMRLLEALDGAVEALTVSELAERIGVDQPRASRLVQQSVELGLVRREADLDDARRTRIALTEQGAAIVRTFRGDRRDAVAQALAAFSAAERAELARLLTKFAQAWPRG